jgi:hypothetical protein
MLYAQSRALDAQRHAADLESNLLLLERSLRESDAAALDWQARAREAESARQEMEQVARSCETAAMQVGAGEVRHQSLFLDRQPLCSSCQPP